MLLTIDIPDSEINAARMSFHDAVGVDITPLQFEALLRGERNRWFLAMLLAYGPDTEFREKSWAALCCDLDMVAYQRPPGKLAEPVFAMIYEAAAQKGYRLVPELTRKS